MTTIQAWFSSEDGESFQLEKQPDLTTSTSPASSKSIIKVNPAVQFQSILGIGASFEEASVYHLTRMSPDKRSQILKDLVDPVEGIGWNLFRICFGTSDFTSQPYYSYDDMPPGLTDEDLQGFSIQRDINLNIMGVLKEVLTHNPEVKFFASPWSPPGWMKTSGSMCGGRLKPEYYAVAARYYRKAIQAYQELGIPIYAFTLQNEPLMEHSGYPTCTFTWREQNAFLKVVKTEFTTHQLETKIWIFDHNFKDIGFPTRILKDPESYMMVDGVAFHSYEGKPSAMSKLHNQFTHKDIYFTEHSEWGASGIDNILRFFRNWAKSYNAWVTVLDDHQQPNPGPHDCDPTFVIVDRENPDNFWYIPEYFLVGQLSKFIQRGAYRIESNYGSRRKVTNAAFQNPDGSIALIVVNQTGKDQPFVIAFPGGEVQAFLPAKTVGTFTWEM